MIPLTEALQAGTLLLFIGDNLPRSLTGLPTRKELAQELAQRYQIDDAVSLADVAQQVEHIGGRFACINFLRQTIDNHRQTNTTFTKQIASIVQRYALRTVVTNTIADVLTSAFQQAGVGFLSVVRDDDVAFISPQMPTLIKLYGDLQQPDSLVITDNDHYALLRDPNKQQLLDTVRQAFNLNTVLFLGYDLSDPDFRFLFDHVANRRFARTAYAVGPNLALADQERWRHQGINILGQDPAVVLQSLIDMDDGIIPANEGNEPLPGQGPEPLGWDRTTIRKLLQSAFSDEELISFCFDHFTAVYDNFATGMTKNAKIQQLMDYAYRQDKVEELVAHVAQINPAQYKQFINDSSV